MDAYQTWKGRVMKKSSSPRFNALKIKNLFAQAGKVYFCLFSSHYQFKGPKKKKKKKMLSVPALPKEEVKIKW